MTPCLGDADLPSQHLQRGGTMSLEDGCHAGILKGSNFINLKSDFRSKILERELRPFSTLC